jgi:hypothetical protein
MTLEVDDEFRQYISSMRVVDLSELLSEISQRKTGRKADLIDRVIDTYTNFVASYKNHTITYNQLVEKFELVAKHCAGYKVPGAARISTDNSTGNERMANNILRGLIEETGSNTNGAQKRPRESEDEGPVKKAKTVAQSANTNLQPQPLVGRPSSTLEGTCVPGTNVRVDLSDDPFFSVETVEPVTYFTLDKDMKKNFYDPIHKQFVISDVIQMKIVKGLRMHLRCFTYNKKNKTFEMGTPRHIWPLNCTLYVNSSLVPIVKNDMNNKNVTELPADISPYVRVGMNSIQIITASMMPCVVVVQMMQRQPIEALMTRVTKNKLDRDEGLKKVKNLFADDNEVLATKTKLTLTDPLLLTRIKTPVRARTCGHFQCFDLFSYLKMNERIRTWTCPICNRPAPFDDLILDEYFQEVLTALSNHDIGEVEIQSDGTWVLPSIEKKDKETPPKKSLTSSVNSNKPKAQELIIDDDSDGEGPSKSHTNNKKDEDSEDDMDAENFLNGIGSSVNNAITLSDSE